MAKLFLLDANVFIESAKRYYAFDVAPGFWKVLRKHVRNGQLRSIDRVLEEVKDGKDAVSDWIMAEIPTAFLKCDESDVVESFSKMMEWVANQTFKPAAISEFAKVADGWLVAYAHAKKLSHNRMNDR